MSLLIDALKKAEQEKKEAAKRLKDAQEKSGEGIQLEPSTVTREEFSSSQAESQITEDITRGSLSISGEKKRTQGSPPSPLEEYTLNKPLDLESTAAELDIQPAPATLSLQKDITQESTLSTSLPGQTRNELSIQQDDQTYSVTNLTIEESSTTPLDDTDQPRVKETFADTLSDSRASRPVVTAAQLVKDIGGGKTGPTPVAAQTVFTAVNTTSGNRQILEWAVFLGLFTVILTAGGALYYLKITPAAVSTSSPLVARGIESELQPPVIVPLPQVITETGTAPAQKAGASMEETDVSVITPSLGETDTEIISEIPSAPSEPVGTPGQSDQPVLETEVDVADVAAQQTEAQIDPAANQESQTLPEEISVDAAAIAISRSRSIDKSDQLISSAYTDYNAGNYSRAEMTYRQILESMPGNRDALLGMAALAHRKGQLQEAYELYLRVLKLYPRDIVATAALINIQGSADPVRSESVLKLMIQEQPDAAFLYFALGNNYASQSRWADAQSAFFEAYQREPASGDFAYNLAVSLDQLGQTRAALDYYQKALELSDQKEPAYNTTAVLARVNTLLAQAQSGP